MNRLKKVLIEREIIWTNNSNRYFYDDLEYCRKLVTFTKDFIIIVSDSNVMNMEFWIYDKNLNLIGGQDVVPEMTFSGVRTFGSWVNVPLKSEDILACM